MTFSPNSQQIAFLGYPNELSIWSIAGKLIAKYTVPETGQGLIQFSVECYENPELYAVDLAIPNDKFVGGFEYENVILNPTQFTTLVNSVEMGEYSYADDKVE